MQNVEEVLSKIYLFSKFTPAELAKIASKVKQLELPIGRTLYMEGSEAKSMYILRAGSLKVLTSSESGDDVKLSTMSAGEHFGELPFLDGERRSAGIEAAETSDILELSYEDVRDVLATSPAMELKFFKEVGYFLVKRFRALTNDMTKAREIKRRYS